MYSPAQTGTNTLMYSPATSRTPSGTVSTLNIAVNVGDTGSSSLSLETVFRANINSPCDLPAAVSAAQSALLSQGRSSSSGSPERRASGPSTVGRVAAGVMAAAEASTDSTGPLKFTRDVVVVEVRGAPVDLTLIDLPGKQLLSKHMLLHTIAHPAAQWLQALSYPHVQLQKCRRMLAGCKGAPTC